MMLKDWWQNLAERERRMLSIGGVVVGVLFLYAVIWSPLDGAVSTQRESLQRQVSLLGYLHHASDTIKQLRARGIQIIPDDKQDVTTHAEVVFSSQSVSAFMKQVHQPAANMVSFTFESAPFDKLIHALHVLAKSDVTVVQFYADRKKQSGLADVRVTLKK